MFCMFSACFQPFTVLLELFSVANMDCLGLRQAWFEQRARGGDSFAPRKAKKEEAAGGCKVVAYPHYIIYMFVVFLFY